jgi:hypothetical protein
LSSGSGVALLAASIATFISIASRKNVTAIQSKPLVGAQISHRWIIAPILPSAKASEASTATPKATKSPVRWPWRNRAASRSS